MYITHNNIHKNIIIKWNKIEQEMFLIFVKYIYIYIYKCVKEINDIILFRLDLP